MPQLVTSTFSSQVFWVLVGFYLVYIFVLKIFSPKMEKILQNRDFHVDELLKTADQFKKDADKLEENSLVALKNIQMKSVVDEFKIVSDFKEQSLKEKQSLRDLFFKKSWKESESLIKSSEKAFFNISKKMDEIVETALNKIYMERKS